MNNSLIGKKLKIIYDDNNPTATIKSGVCKQKDNEFLVLENERNITEFLVVSRIIRIEVQNDNKINT